MLRWLKYSGIIVIMMAVHAHAQRKWVPFLEQKEAKPKVALQNSTNKNVSFSVQIKGMSASDILQGESKFQRLSIPEAGNTRKEGSPEVPMITELIAVPDCDDVMLSVTPSDECYLSDYNVYPAPGFEEKEWPDGTHNKEEIFKKDQSVYSMDDFFPYKYGEIIETGYVRSQKVIRIALYPIQFNPIQRKIKAFTNFQISLSFVNATSPVNKELGIFRNMMHNVALNYELDGISASTKDTGLIEGNKLDKTEMITGGSVTRVTNLSLLTNPPTSNPTPCDYLIITHSNLFNSASLTSLANQRMNRNGFNVVIVKVNGDPGINDCIYDFYPDPVPPQDNYVSVRNFIQDVYLHGKANHTYDGKLGCFVLVGDANFNNTTEMVPAAYPSRYGSDEQGGDYYYACIQGDTDDFMDLMYGRISVGDEMELSNVVNKIINYESSSSGDWRNYKTFLAFSPDRFAYADPAVQAMTQTVLPPATYKGYFWRGYTGTSSIVTLSDANPIVSRTFSQADWQDGSKNCYADECRHWLYDRINGTGSGSGSGQHIFIYEGHGRQASLGANEGTGRTIFRANDLNDSLSNNNKCPFMIFNCCESGMFDATTYDDTRNGYSYWPLHTIDCIAEAVVNITNKGAIACLASTRDSDAIAFGSVDKKIVQVDSTFKCTTTQKDFSRSFVI